MLWTNRQSPFNFFNITANRFRRRGTCFSPGVTERLCSVSVASCSGGSSAFVRSVSAVMLRDDMEGHVFVTSGVKTSVTTSALDYPYTDLRSVVECKTTDSDSGTEKGKRGRPCFFFYILYKSCFSFSDF